jgi:sugar O-acyltransferase (sialic acid O-acetyltransferase NeuD family)
MTLYVVGAGGAGRETYDALLAAGRDIDAFVDDRLAGRTIRGMPVVAPDDVTAGEYVVGIADPRARSRLVSLLDGRGLTAVTVIHPRAVVGPDTTLGAGCVVLANAHVSSSITIGAHCQVHYNATVGHDTSFAERVTVYPGANISGSVRIEADATVGSGAIVLQGLTVGAAAFVGAGAVVTRNVPDNTVVTGCPARPHTG